MAAALNVGAPPGTLRCQSANPRLPGSGPASRSMSSTEMPNEGRVSRSRPWCRGRFLTEDRNVVLLCPPGTGKTHLAICLGTVGAHHGRQVLFATANEWATRLRDAHRAGQPPPGLARAATLRSDPHLKAAVQRLGHRPWWPSTPRRDDRCMVLHAEVLTLKSASHPAKEPRARDPAQHRGPEPDGLGIRYTLTSISIVASAPAF